MLPQKMQLNNAGIGKKFISRYLRRNSNQSKENIFVPSYMHNLIINPSN